MAETRARAKGRSKRKPVAGSGKAPKVSKDPLREYDALINQDGVKAVSVLDDDCASNVRCWVPTGSLALDRLLCGRGVPCSRITEIYGPEHVGKSTLLDQVFTQVQHMGGFGVVIETEGARDQNYMCRGLGVDPGKLRFLEFPDPMDVHIEGICDAIIRSIDFWRGDFHSTPVVIGWDSLGATTTRDELAKDVGSRNVAAAAKAMRDGMRKIAMRLARSNVALVIVNHQYTAINTGGAGRPARRETYAGQALRLAATMRLELFNLGVIKRDDGVVQGRKIGARLDKNRFGKCQETRLAMMTGSGTHNVWTIFEELKDRQRLSVNGAWATLKLGDDQLKFQGWAGLTRKCEEDPALFDRLVALYSEVLDAYL